MNFILIYLDQDVKIEWNSVWLLDPSGLSGGSMFPGPEDNITIILPSPQATNFPLVPGTGLWSIVHRSPHATHRIPHLSLKVKFMKMLILFMIITIHCSFKAFERMTIFKCLQNIRRHFYSAEKHTKLESNRSELRMSSGAERSGKYGMMIKKIKLIIDTAD